MGGSRGGPEGVEMTIFWSVLTDSARIRVFPIFTIKIWVILAKYHFFSCFSSKSWGFGRKTRILVGKTNTNSNFLAESGRCTLGPPPDPPRGGVGGVEMTIFWSFLTVWTPKTRKPAFLPNYGLYSQKEEQNRHIVVCFLALFFTFSLIMALFGFLCFFYVL